MAEASTELPSYSAATADDAVFITPTTHEPYSDFTIGELRVQILANAAMLKPFFTADRSRTDYELELILLHADNGQHRAVLVRRNVLQRRDADLNPGKIILLGALCDTPRIAFEALLRKTAEVLAKMVKTKQIQPPTWGDVGDWSIT